jgi:hypothetical protein
MKAKFGQGKSTKQAANFEFIAAKDAHCSECHHFLLMTCARVVGIIPPFSWCRYYSKKGGSLEAGPGRGAK